MVLCFLLFEVERNLNVSICFQPASHISMSRVSLGVMSATASSLERKRLRVTQVTPGVEVEKWMAVPMTQAVWSSDDPLCRHTPSSPIILMMYAARESDSSLKSSPLIMRLDSVYSFRFFSNQKLVLFCTGIDVLCPRGLESISSASWVRSLFQRSDEANSMLSFGGLPPGANVGHRAPEFRDLSSDPG